MRRNASDESLARDRLRSEILDQPAWEKLVLFAAERLSREEDGNVAVAHAVRLALAIDPMLAAEMIFRSAPGCGISLAPRWKVLFNGGTSRARSTGLFD